MLAIELDFRYLWILSMAFLVFKFLSPSRFAVSTKAIPVYLSLDVKTNKSAGNIL